MRALNAWLRELTPNKRVQATAYSFRSASAFSRA
jgi:hypothetical protein